jgi:hypothetical protein
MSDITKATTITATKNAIQIPIFFNAMDLHHGFFCAFPAPGNAVPASLARQLHALESKKQHLADA